MKPFTRGEAARKAGVGIETLRFYERKGLIAEPPRSDFGHRLYPRHVITRLRFIRRAQELGFSLKEISELLDLRVDPTTTCADVKQQAQAKIVDVQHKIEDLEKMKIALEKLTAACTGEGPTSDCPILDALESEEEDTASFPPKNYET